MNIRVLLPVLPITLAVSIASAQIPRTRDSAGVHIVENAARRNAPVAFVPTEVVVADFGGLKDNPDDEFEVRGPFLRSIHFTSGGYVVTDNHRLRFFDAAHKQVHVAGRQGQGPMEFRQISSACRTHGDTVVVGDPLNARVSVWDRNGNFVREFPVARARLSWESCFDDGTFLLTEGVQGVDGSRITRLSRHRLDGSVISASLGEFPAGVRSMYLLRDVYVAASGDHYFVGDSRTREIRGYDQGGKLTMIIRTADPVDKVTAAEAAAMSPTAAGTNARIGPPPDPKPTEWPAYGAIATDMTGRVWVEDYRKAYTQPDVWTAFDRDGRMLGRFSMPPNPKIEDPRFVNFTDEGVQVRRQDTDGAVHVTTYRIRK